MQVGDLIRVRHHGVEHNGKIGVLVRIGKANMNTCTSHGFKVFYSVRIPSLTYEISLTNVQCEVLS